MCTVRVHFAIDIQRTTLSTTLNTILFAARYITKHGKSERKMGIFKKSMRVIQGYTVVVEFFKICEITENRLKLIEMDNLLHM